MTSNNQKYKFAIMSGSVKVAVRVRPFNKREKVANADCIIEMDGQNTKIIHPESKKEYKFAFDYSYWSFGEQSRDGSPTKLATQDSVFEDLGKNILKDAFEGFNSSLFAYGQTGAGKSFSMIGIPTAQGIVPRVCKELFERIDEAKKDNKGVQYRVEMTMLEIYNEQVRDLFNPKYKPKGGLKVREHPKTGVFVEKLKKVSVYSYEEIEQLMEDGNKARSIGSTKMNATSSRAHTMVSLIFSQITKIENKEQRKTSRIVLVDLAGSEKLKHTGAKGGRMKEGININKSLSTLGNCITALAEKCSGKKGVFVPFRNSKLTFIMKDVLGGNSKTAMIAAISPASINFDESLGTLRYAKRAKKIKLKAKVNEDPTASLIKSLREEIAQLKEQLSNKESGIDVNDATEQIDELARMMEDYTMTEEERKERDTKLKEQRKQYLENFGLKDFDKTKSIHLLNLNEDPALSELLLYELPVGKTTVGKDEEEDESKKPNIPLSGDLQDLHCYFVVSEDPRKVVIHPQENADTFINGQLISQPTQLTHRDRVCFNTSQFFCLIDPKAAKKQKGAVIDFEKAVLELADSLAKKKSDEIIEKQKEQHKIENEALMKQIAVLKSKQEDSAELIAKLKATQKAEEEKTKLELEQTKKDLQMKVLGREKLLENKDTFANIGKQSEFTNLLMITIAECKNLKKADIFSGSSDPYVKIEILDKNGVITKTQKTKTIKKCLNPFYDETHVFRVTNYDLIRISVWDWDLISADDFLGDITLTMADVPKKKFEKTFKLSGVKHGEIRIKLWNGECIFVPEK